ncbi:MAG: aspartate aminotransferase family protein [bacterium]|nr:aspartate aminotransferase family protein [bacterium]
MRYFGRKTASYYERMHNALLPTTIEDFRPVIKSASGVCVTDVDGNTFLDFTSQVGIVVDHVSEDVVSAVQEQATRALGIISNDFQFASVHGRGSLKGEEVSPVKLAEELIKLVPVPYPKKVLFEVSGATAVNAAIKICRAANPGRFWFGAFEKAFHGRHGPSLDISSSKPIHKQLHIDGNIVARCPFPNINISFEDFKEGFTALFRKDPQHDIRNTLCAFFVEIVQGEGGINIPNFKALNWLHRQVKNIGGLFVADEVQTGLGRTGKMFASEYLDEPPDMIILSKALGAGVPIGAVVTRTDILPNGTIPQSAHSGTMPACPLAVAAALANLRFMQDEGLVRNSAEMGKYLRGKLRKIADSNSVISDVDSLGGLMIRVEFATKTAADKAVIECLNQDPGLLLIEAGDKTIRFMPPLTVSKEEIDLALSIFSNSLKTLV